MHSVSFALLAIIAFSEASVDFSNSTLYDVYDFVGVEEVHISKCDFGCIIFVSTLGAFPQSPDNLDPFARNLLIRNNDDGTSYSVTTLAANFDTDYWKDNRKKPLEIQGPANISLLNTNEADAVPNAMFLWVIEMSKAEEFSYYNTNSALQYTYAVYDPIDIDYRKIKITSEVVTYLSSHPFTIKAEKGGMWLDIAARLTGFDNIHDDNGDDCPIALLIPASTNSPGINLQLSSPMISFALWRNGDLELTAGIGSSDTLDMDADGFIASEGYNGCAKSNSGGYQTSKSTMYQNSSEFVIASEDYYKIDVDVLPFIDNNHYVRIIEEGAPTVNNIFGTQEQKLSFPKTKELNVAWTEFPDNQGFLMRYSTTPTDPKATTKVITTTTALKQPTTTKAPTTTTKGRSKTNDSPVITTTTPSGSPSTTTTQMPTTSSSWNCQLSFGTLLAVFIALNGF